jgi:hypothetical protein
MVALPKLGVDELPGGEDEAASTVSGSEVGGFDSDGRFMIFSEG